MNDEKCKRDAAPVAQVGAMAKALTYGYKRRDALTPYLDKSTAEIDNNTAERAMRAITIGRKNWLFAGSIAGDERTAAIYTVIETCKHNGDEPQVYTADIIEKIASGRSPSRWYERMLRNWQLAIENSQACCAMALSRLAMTPQGMIVTWNMRKPDYPSANAASWNRVDAYFAERLSPDDVVLAQALAANAAAGLPAHDVSAMQGQLLAILIQTFTATRVLEIGTLGGYSTIRMARALPAGGKIVTIERDPNYAAVAQRNIDRAGLGGRVDLRIGTALDVLPTLVGPFDLIFIDADKTNNPSYLDWALRLSGPGTLIVGDNVVRGGAVIDTDSQDGSVEGVRRFIDLIAAHPRILATAIQTVGEKGWDGFVLARVGP